MEVESTTYYTLKRQTMHHVWQIQQVIDGALGDLTKITPDSAETLVDVLTFVAREVELIKAEWVMAQDAIDSETKKMLDDLTVGYKKIAAELELERLKGDKL